MDKDFSPETWMELSVETVEEWKKLEDDILMYKYKALLENQEASFDDWLEHQMSNINKVNRGIVAIVEKHKPSIMESMKKAFNEATNIAVEELKTIANEKPIVVSNDEAVKARLGLVDENFKLLVENQTRATASLPAKIYSNIISQEGNKSWTMEKHLEVLHKAIETGYKRELPRMTGVTYANGREVSFKSYIEMAIRTEINNVAVDMVSEGSKGLGIVLFLCSRLQDSADDHAPYQGKVYILENWESIVSEEDKPKYKDLIEKRNIKTLEWAKDYGTYQNKKGKTYNIHLGTRPNCRHTFTPITLEQALNVNATLNKLGNKSVGRYSPDKYKAMQKQRALERNIRSLKLEYNNVVSMIKATKNYEELAKLQSHADEIRKAIRNAQERMRDFLKEPGNQFLQRMYERENPLRVATNLGVK